MELRLAALSVAFLAAPAFAQDPGSQAIEQMNVQNQINLTNQQNANAALAADNNGTPQPAISIKSGTYPGPITVTLKPRAAKSQTFYTLDGWTPTAESTLYTGPITISSTQTLRAVSISPHTGPSFVVMAAYTLPARPQPVAVATAPATGPTLIPQGTPVQLRFTNALDSQHAKVGQTLQLALAEDLVLDGRLIAPAGTPALARLTRVKHPGRGYIPGSLTFAVQSIRIDGADVALAGTRTRQGAYAPTGQVMLTAIPVVGIINLLNRGEQAQISDGDRLVATVAATVTLQPAP